MSLEITNLSVKISVNQANSEGGEGSSTKPSETDTSKSASPEKLVTEVVEQILSILDNKNER